MSLLVPVGPSIDWLDVRFPVPADAPVVGREFLEVGPDGEAGQRRVHAAWHRLVSGSVFKARVCEGVALVDANPARVRSVHSLVGPADGEEALRMALEALSLVSAVRPGGPAAAGSYFAGKDGDRAERVGEDRSPSLHRVDVCQTFQFGALGDGRPDGAAEADAKAFLRALSSRTVNGTRGYLYRNGRTVDFKFKDFRISYYLKWGAGLAKPGPGSDAAAKAAHLSLDVYLQAVGAVRHEVNFRREWLRREGAVSPASWTRERVGELLARYAPHSLSPVTGLDLSALELALLSRGEHPRRAARLKHFAARWLRGEDLSETCSRATWYRLRSDLRPFGFDIGGAPPSDGAPVRELVPVPLAVPVSLVGEAAQAALAPVESVQAAA